ncbi:hypothetical protein Dsin_032492 [Dipteronia sinensis]|uniref:HVA22-like protein n=1 Tax=Dipteronia sinensis TaxID=43782 RepID=A0AAE0DT46_9ROSI|nr:hypothetical protein Dsin_032492 [Dipteronia sinensis]
MGFVGLFMFAVKCFNVLAWPLFGLVYPLWASIRVIEADDSSSSDCKNLVAYWVLFSLIFLFEQAFHNLLLWLPFWLYIKLIITCWLVTPNFYGALYAYKHLVCPCLSIDIKVLINKFNAQFFSKRSNFEDEVKSYVKENGLEALEKLVASKLDCSREPNVVQKEVKTAQVKEQIKEVSASEQVKFVPHFLPEVCLTGPDICQTENTKAAENTKPDTDLTASEKVEAVGKSFEIPVPEQVQKEWTCAICQLTVKHETVLKIHLQGKRHKAACEKIKTKTQLFKNKASSDALENKLDCSREPNVVQKEVKTAQVTEQIKEVSASEQVKFVPHFLPEVSLTGPDISRTENTKPDTDLTASEKMEAVGESFEIPVPEQVQKEWTCAICQLTVDNERVLNSHLQGKRHKAACEKIKTKTQLFINKASSAAQENKEQNNSATGSKGSGTRKEEMQGPEEKLKSKCVELRENLWWCNICNISCTCESNMDTHLSAKKHLSRIVAANA